VSARSDAVRIHALVKAVEALASGEAQTLGDLAMRVFGWDPERVFLAIDHAVHEGRIAKGGRRLPFVEKPRLECDAGAGDGGGGEAR
jgi:hypothetical protein